MTVIGPTMCPQCDSADVSLATGDGRYACNLCGTRWQPGGRGVRRGKRGRR